ncbi:dephospho-CoA kinase [Scopulibacillus daqui]|uniref:Dephospho-CoA kinase n=1 Tax=Scopulibacillus daqui TaxID=1469162 RepID=A0ABS2PXL5_9BACL|nr:dephospho-CoA kinase [Scopulibacillus daqui]MBM7644784.1 dephospho-CoA kinase [Scopulibacillus daqui]
MMKIGLTGGIASGKSTVSAMIKDFGIPVVDADRISREVVEPGEEAYKQIVASFGSEILFDNGQINRKKLGNIVFQDADKRQMLNRIVHPQVRKSMLQKVNAYERQGEAVTVLDIPLLFESKLTEMVDKTLLVYVDAKTQLERLMNRDQSSEKEALDRIRSQMPLDEKRALVDAVIDNNGSTEETLHQLKRIFRLWHIF